MPAAICTIPPRMRRPPRTTLRTASLSWGCRGSGSVTPSPMARSCHDPVESALRLGARVSADVPGTSAIKRPKTEPKGVLEGQRALAMHPWPPGVVLRVRIGVHTSEATPVGDDYGDLAAHQVARISAGAHAAGCSFPQPRQPPSRAGSRTMSPLSPSGCFNCGAFRTRSPCSSSVTRTFAGAYSRSMSFRGGMNILASARHPELGEERLRLCRRGGGQRVRAASGQANFTR
jgi:hypothetical protein